jgi:hypothetical protein
MTVVQTPPWWRRTLDRIMTPETERDDVVLREAAQDKGAVPAASCCDRQRVSVHGTLRSVTVHPSEDLPRLQADLYDGTGEVMLVWLGRKRIRAIEPGRSLTAEGLVLVDEGRRVIYNPRYELDPLPQQ